MVTVSSLGLQKEAIKARKLNGSVIPYFALQELGVAAEWCTTYCGTCQRAGELLNDHSSRQAPAVSAVRNASDLFRPQHQVPRGVATPYRSLPQVSPRPVLQFTRTQTSAEVKSPQLKAPSRMGTWAALCVREG